MDKKTKQPGDKLDYDISAEDWLSDGDYVITATSAVTPSGLTLVSTTVFNSGKTVKVWVSGGTNLAQYKITTTCTTNAGRIKEKEFLLTIKEI